MRNLALVLITMVTILISFGESAAQSSQMARVAEIGPVAQLGGTLSGKVIAPKEFKAAQVYARNIDRNVMYMVYTSGGSYRFMHLFPGSYEVSVYKNGFTSKEIQKIDVAAGKSGIVNFDLQEGVHVPNQRTQLEYPRNLKFLPYDTVYPPGPGRDIVQNCLVCHGPDWIPQKHWSADVWNVAIDDMIARGNVRSPGSFSAAERKVLVDYLAQNFGPHSEARGVAEPDIEVDEKELSKAMFVEYRLPPLPKGHHVENSGNADEGDTPQGACTDCGDRRLHDPHIGNDGNVWYADQAGIVIGRVDPRTAKFRDYPITDPQAAPHGLTMDQKGQIWFTSSKALGKLDPKTGNMELYSRPDIRSAGNTPTIESNGNVWYTGGVSEIAKLDIETRKVSWFKTPSFEPQPYGMVTDKNDNLWFAELAQCKVVRFDPVQERFTEFSPPYPDKPCTIRRLSFDHDGTLWYGLAGMVNGFAHIGKMDPNTSRVVEYAMPYMFSYPYDIQPDPENNMWVTDAGQGGALVKFDRKTEKFIYFPMPQYTDMPKLEVTKDGAVWYTTRSGSSKTMAIGVLFPDMEKIKSFAAYNQLRPGYY